MKSYLMKCHSIKNYITVIRKNYAIKTDTMINKMLVIK